VSASVALLPRPRRTDLSTTQVQRKGEPAVATDRSLPPQGYRLSVASDGAVTIDARDDAGAFYGRCTLQQLARVGHDGSIPVGEIEDWPDLPIRGVMLDISRCRVPTLASLISMVDRLASWKINHLQLYMEHTFAYPGHEDVWNGADPLTASEMVELAAHCQTRHVELVPNQNTLGHMERWLVHPRYAPLGISRGVVTTPWGSPSAASTIDPTNDGSIDLVRELIGVLAEAVPASRFHVGLDEPWDLPADRSSDWADWARRLRALPELSGREMLVWGDMLAAHGDLCASLPEGMTVCEWGYEAGHPFLARSRHLADSGITRWLSPGTSSWLSLVGRTTNAVDNCREAVKAAVETGAEGLLVTDWGDFGHHQPRTISDPALAAAAAFGWCLSANADLAADDIGRLLDQHCYDDGHHVLGTALVTLGDLYRTLPLQAPNMSGLVLHFYLPQLAFGSGFSTGTTLEHLEVIEAMLRKAEDDLSGSAPGNEHGGLAARELATAAAMVMLAVEDGRARLAADGSLASVPEKRRRQLAAQVDGVIPDFRRDWLVRDRPGGLDESCQWLLHLKDCYLSGEASSDWAGPLVEQARSGT
jgi:hexosaminidase